MTLSKLVNLRELEQLLLLVAQEAEKNATDKWKSFVKTVKTVIYTVMVARILIAIYFKVNSKND